VGTAPNRLDPAPDDYTADAVRCMVSTRIAGALQAASEPARHGRREFLPICGKASALTLNLLQNAKGLPQAEAAQKTQRIGASPLRMRSRSKKEAAPELKRAERSAVPPSPERDRTARRNKIRTGVAGAETDVRQNSHSRPGHFNISGPIKLTRAAASVSSPVDI
jgi:hypothetical protein